MEKFDHPGQISLIFTPMGTDRDHIRVHFHLQNEYSMNFKYYNRNKWNWMQFI